MSQPQERGKGCWLYGDSVGGAIVPEDGENFLTELARSVLEEQELPDLQQLFAAADQVTHSALGCPTAVSPSLPVLSAERLREELWEAQRAREATRARQRLARRQQRITQQLQEANVQARQLGMF